MIPTKILPIFIYFSLIFVVVQSNKIVGLSAETTNDGNKAKVENVVEMKKSNEGEINENSNGIDGKEKIVAKVEEGNKERKIGSNEMEKVSTENEENEGKNNAKIDEEKEFNRIVNEDKKIVEKFYLNIKSKLDEEEEAKKREQEKGNNIGKGQKHHLKKHEKMMNNWQIVANSIANIEMKCPGIFKRFWGKTVNFVKRDEAAERKEAEWSQNCHILSMMKTAVVDWLEFIAKYEEKSMKKEKNKSNVEGEEPNFPGKMSVRPILQKVYPIQDGNKNKTNNNQNQQQPPTFKGDLVELEEMLEIYKQISVGKVPDNLKQLFWDNEAAYKFVKKLQQKLEQDEKHENMAEEDKDESDLEEIWKEKAVLGGQMSEFKLEKNQKKYSEHVDEHKEREFGAFGTIWNYGKSIKDTLLGQRQTEKKQLSVGA